MLVNAGLATANVALICALLAALPLSGGAAPGAATKAPNHQGQRAGQITTRRFRLPKGGSLAGLLTKTGIPAGEVQAAGAALRKVADPRRLPIGTRVTLRLQAPHRQPRLLAVSLELSSHRYLTLVARSDGSFARRRGGASLLPTAPAQQEIEGQVRGGSLTASLRKIGVPATVIAEVCAAFHYDPKLPEHPPRGSRVQVVYTPAGEDGPARMQMAELTRKRHSHRVYRYELHSGQVAFVEPSGKGVLPMHLALPVPGARLSSGWGWRLHPILKRELFHKGIDLAAPLGTPIHAATSGVVEFAGWHGNYGRLLRIRHDDRVTLQYGHLDGFAKGLRPGQRVARGQVVATVGESGLATGPHLYWEVLVDHKHVDPTSRELAVPLTLAGDDLVRFHDYVQDVGEGPAAAD
jgi:Peptidase family M23